MVSDKLKRVIYKYLNKELKGVEIIPHGKSTWFINREKKYWYFELSETYLWWRYDYFTSLFQFFSLDSDQFSPILSQWVSDTLKSSTPKRSLSFGSNNFKADIALNNKVTTPVLVTGEVTPNPVTRNSTRMVDEVLNSKVVTPAEQYGAMVMVVDEVLNSKVVTPSPSTTTKKLQVDEVLNSNVVTSGMMLSYENEEVIEVLNSKEVTSANGSIFNENRMNKVLETKSLSYYPEIAIDLVLNKK